MGVTVAQRHVEVPQIQVVDVTVEVPVQKQVHVPVVTTVQKAVEVPQVEFVDNHVHIPVQKHRHVPMVTKIQKPVEVTVIETVEKIVDVPVVKQVEVPQIQTIEKIVEVPFVQTVEKIVEVPQIGETLAGVQKHTTVQLETVRQEAPVEMVQEVVQGPPLPAEHGPSVMITDQHAMHTIGQPMMMTGPAVGSMMHEQVQAMGMPTTTYTAAAQMPTATYAEPPMTAMAAEPVTYGIPQTIN